VTLQGSRLIGHSRSHHMMMARISSEALAIDIVNNAAGFERIGVKEDVFSLGASDCQDEMPGLKTVNMLYIVED
jgi:hypothetical protein